MLTWCLGGHARCTHTCQARAYHVIRCNNQQQQGVRVVQTEGHQKLRLNNTKTHTRMTHTPRCELSCGLRGVMTIADCTKEVRSMRIGRLQRSLDAACPMHTSPSASRCIALRFSATRTPGTFINLPRPSNSMLRVTRDVWLVTCRAPNDARSAELADGKAGKR